MIVNCLKDGIRREDIPADQSHREDIPVSILWGKKPKDGKENGEPRKDDNNGLHFKFR